MAIAALHSFVLACQRGTGVSGRVGCVCFACLWSVRVRRRVNRSLFGFAEGFRNFSVLEPTGMLSRYLLVNAAPF